jgi:hypothetical protein
VTLKMPKNLFHVFSYTYLQAHYLQSKKFYFLLKFRVKILFCKHYVSPINTFMSKGKDPDSEQDPELDPYL